MASTIWVKGPAGSWIQDGKAYARVTTGYRPVTRIYEKTGKVPPYTWQQRYYRDATPPATLASLTATMSGTDLVATMVAPADTDTTKLVIKRSTTNYPTAPYPLEANGYEATVAPNGTVKATYHDQSQSGQVNYFAAWAIDAAGNASSAKLLKYTVPNIAGIPGAATKSAYILTTDSNSWDNVNNHWRSDYYVGQAGVSDWKGMWFYSGRIKATLANARRVTKMQIRVGRLNTVHGIVGEASVRVNVHKYSTQPSTEPTLLAAGSYVGGLNRGEYKWFDVPSTWWDELLLGSYVGLGLEWQTTSGTDPNYLFAYGYGTESGKLYVEWTE